MPDLHWITVPFIMLGLSALLIWGLRKNPNAQWRKHRDEIEADDPPRETFESLASFAATDHRLPAQVVDLRRMLSSTWGPSLPDMLVTFWADTPGARSEQTTHRQVFLPTVDSTREFLQRVEDLCDSVISAADFSQSQFITSYCFIHAPQLNGDIVIKSFATEHNFAHQFFMLDADGKLIGLPIDPDEMLGDIIGEETVGFRRGLSAVSEDRRTDAIDQFIALVRNDISNAHAHAWLSLLHTLENQDSSAARRELAFAKEFSVRPHHLSLLIANATNPDTPRLVARELRRHALGMEQWTPHSVQLLCEGLLLLRQHAAARELAAMGMTEMGNRIDAARLMSFFDSDQRGAQT